jgi:hypothetical protein
MHNYDQKLPRDVQEGLISILLNAANAKEAGEPCTVITRSPGTWLAAPTSDSVTLLDLTGLIGASPWSSEQDLRDRLIDKITAAGWPETQVGLEQHSTSSLVADPRKVQIRAAADLIIFDGDGTPIAVGEVKRPGRPINSGIEQAKFLAKAFAARFAFSSDGERFLFLDFRDQSTRELAEFPSPAELGASVPPIDEAGFEDKQRVGIVRCETLQILLDSLSQSRARIIIVDHTVPFGLYQSNIAEEIRRSLPLPQQTVRRIDLLAALILAAATQKVTERLTALVPLTFLAAPSFEGTRNYLQARLGLAGVAELPPSTFAPITTLPPALIVLGANRSDKQVVFSSASSRGDIVQPESQPWFQSFTRGLRGEATESGFLARVPQSQPWTLSRYRPEVKLAEAQLEEVFSSRALSDLFDIIQGYHHPREEDRYGVPFVRGRDLSSSPLGKEQLAKFKSGQLAPERAMIRTGDVLLQRIGAKPQCLVAGPELEGVAAADTVVILRPNSESADPALLVQFLRSTIGQDLLLSRAQTATAPTLRLSALSSLPIPSLSGVVSNDLDELQAIEQDLRSRADKLASMRLQLFSADSAENLDLRLKQIRQSALAIDASIQQAETAEFQIRNFYPFPLAYPYRTLSSPTVLQDRYKQQLRISENILAYLGSLSLALTYPNQLAELPLLLKQAWQGGISPGHWRDISQKTSELFRSDADTKLAVSLGSLWKARGGNKFPKNVEQLIKAKNDFKHDRWPIIEEEYKDATESLEKLLEEVMIALAFFTEYPIRLVTDLDGVRGSRRVIVQALRFVGDHPALIQELVEYPETLIKGDLYVEMQEGSWKALFPFISVHNCPDCKYRETYFVDRWKRAEGKAILKSFERGHTIEHREIAASLTEWIKE